MKQRAIRPTPYMIRAFLEGRKTRYSEIVKPRPSPGATRWNGECWEIHRGYPVGHENMIHGCPFAAGDILWAQEAHWHNEVFHAECLTGGYAYEYCATRAAPPGSADPADYHTLHGYWQKRSSAQMPRRAARVVVRVSRTWVEPVRDITDEGAIAEGIALPYAPKCNYHYEGAFADAFRAYWIEHYGGESWERDWLWCADVEGGVDRGSGGGVRGRGGGVFR